MKGSLDRTKVVLRHLPHNISQSAFMEQIDGRFSGRYNWFCFRSGENSLKIQSYSRAYIDFKQPDDVIEFAEFFDGHVFVNEKGTQFKTIVEYAPSQRVPKQCSKKDGREGSIEKDPQYLEFLELIAKPVENLPSAEIQLERKEAERAGTAKEAPIVTPLMEFIRQKRAAKGGPRRSLPNGKLPRRGSGASSSISSSAAVKRGSERRRTSTTMYVPRGTGKGRSGKEKSTYVEVQKHEVSEKPVGPSSVSGSVVLDEGRDIGKKKILLLKGKEKEIEIPNTVKLSQQRESSSGRIIRSILINKQNQISNDKPTTRNKDTPPLQQQPTDSVQGIHGEMKYEVSNSKGGDFKPIGSGRAALDNGSYKHGGRRGPSYNAAKDTDGSEGKPSKRGIPTSYGSHEKQVWVQKSSSGT